MNLRIKTGQQPGDVSKQSKQRMLEKPKDEGQKGYKKTVRIKERAVLKRRSKARIKADIE